MWSSKERRVGKLSQTQNQFWKAMAGSIPGQAPASLMAVVFTLAMAGSIPGQAPASLMAVVFTLAMAAASIQSESTAVGETVVPLTSS
jgi:putative Ca2+/H+ antiporter (TMEM165/GDT1 family)